MRTWRALPIVATAGLVTCAQWVGAPHATADTGDWLDAVPIDVRPTWETPSGIPEFGPTTGEQVALTGAAAWHDAGFDGSGVKIGVIDFFDVDLYWDEAEHGPAPMPGVTALCLSAGNDCSQQFFDGVDAGAEAHGVAVVEVIKDMAPGAQIYIARGLTASDYQAIIDWFAAAGVSVVNRSLGSRYDGPGDGRGGIDDVAAYANSRGITWVNSGGNNALGKYYRHQVRLIGDRVAFGPSGSATFLRFTGCAELGGVRWANDWDKPPSERTDYDVFIWDAPFGDPAAGTIVASATAAQRSGAPPLEQIGQQVCPSGPSGTRALYLEVRWRGGDVTGDILEILDYGHGMASFTQAEHSASTGIADSTLPGVLAVGAIDPAASGTIAPYSSRGPTNDGRIAPDLSAPAHFSSTVESSGFSGTSAAAAVVSGGAALMIQAGLAAGPGSLGDLIRHIATDRGDPGPDHSYGHGEFRLPEPPVAIDATPSTFVPLPAPQRILDTRPESPVGPAHLIGAMAPGDIRDLPVAGQAGIPPTGVTAVAVNVTGVGIDRPAFVQALPTLRASLGGYSNVNTDQPSQTRSNFAIVPVGAGGSISIYGIGAGHAVVDVLGYFSAAPNAVAGGRFVELAAPQRVLDTRVGGGPLADQVVRPVPWPAAVDPAQVRALVVTVTGTEATQPGWIQVYPSDRPDVIGTTSTVNIDPGLSVANAAIVGTGSTGVSVAGYFGTGSGHVVVDVVGYVTSDAAPPATSGRFVPVRPARAFDSRAGTGVLAAGVPVEIDASAAPGVSVPGDAAAVVWNLAAVDALRPGFGRVWAAAAPEPDTSAFNWALVGETRASSVVASVDAGRVRVLLHDGVGQGAPVGHLVADVFGYFT